jgi:AcrR family transcriptional regulator
VTASDVQPPEVRPMRADAQRNREKLLEAAESVFASQGIAVPIDEIARAAGVGAGTVYRHFPTKEALFEAIVMNRLERLVETARELSESDDPGAALFDFLDELGEQIATKRDLSDALANAGVDIKEHAAYLADEMRKYLDLMLERAQQAGAVRTDISCPDVFALVVGTCKASDSGIDGAARVRMLKVVCDGLRTAPTS